MKITRHLSSRWLVLFLGKGTCTRRFKISADEVGADALAVDCFVEKERVGGVLLGEANLEVFSDALSVDIIGQLLFAVFNLSLREEKLGFDDIFAAFVEDENICPPPSTGDFHQGVTA